MTKMITSLGCLQLVEQGRLALDDPAVIETHLPELCAMPILTDFEGDTPITVERKTPITLRHLLTHTSGLTYGLHDPLVAKWEKVTGAPSWMGKNAPPESLFQPLIFEPGENFQYGLGIDLAGLLLMRVTGQTLEEYFHVHIFGPSGISKEDISFYPTDSIKARLMQVCAMLPDGSLVPNPGLRDIQSYTPSDVGVNLGGAGLLGTPKAYMAVQRQILLGKEGKSSVVSKATFDALFAPSLPSDGACKSDLGNMILTEGMFEPQFASGRKVNHTVAMAYLESDSPTGMKAGTGFWGGAARTRFWIDPESGIAGWYGTQMFDMGEVATFAKAFNTFQETVYASLE